MNSVNKIGERSSISLMTTTEGAPSVVSTTETIPAPAAAAVASSGVPTSTPRRHRYIRSSTASVTQILSDRCNSLLQRFRRNPSERPDKRPNRLDLSPPVVTADIVINPDSSTPMSDRHSRYNTSGYGSYAKSSTSSALDRLRSNLSPVSSYYKPLMRTFGKRDDNESPTKVSINTNSNGLENIFEFI